MRFFLLWKEEGSRYTRNYKFQVLQNIRNLIFGDFSKIQGNTRSFTGQSPMIPFSRRSANKPQYKMTWTLIDQLHWLLRSFTNVRIDKRYKLGEKKRRNQRGRGFRFPTAIERCGRRYSISREIFGKDEKWEEVAKELFSLRVNHFFTDSWIISK